MDHNFQGDLTDILRASGSTSAGPSSVNSGYGELGLPNITDDNNNSNWQFPSDLPLNFPSISSMEDLPRDSFGDPFSNMRDPLFHELSDVPPGPAFFGSPNSENIISDGGGGGGGFGEMLGPSHHHHHVGLDHHHQEDVKFRPSCNIFSRMLQINPSGKLPAATAAAAGATTSSPQCDSAANMATAASPRGIKAAAVISGDMINVNSSQQGCLVENNTGSGMQISSPRNPGIKRRKSQAKKVVCIPAPAAANSRASGEVVPSDLWAWRKYGQKPIKGSPYPRGYYRCSSSKGCSARKQVERSRTDPNMLVVTYTSEHNHPWPTQRNALAGSTRSQPSKNNNNNATIIKNSPINSHLHQKNNNNDNVTASTTSPKEEQKDHQIIISNNVENNNNGSTSTTSASMKEEVDQDVIEKQLDSLDDSAFIYTAPPSEVGFGYRPAMPGSNHDQDSFFADLGEIEADPLNLLFGQAGFSSSSSSAADHDHQHKGMMMSNKGLDPFNLFD
ncbi:putative WRKY transcription factor 35 [Morus notabilis]|uniref:Putative WRKY transcription factor 35 n=2 Tax=Morus notabilis TaxID=981085 RepID=W9R7G3_9ROSA|nr:putative WRKY transcription factor 35 [Morus notabilis]